jgi:hypothetical protein
MYPLIMSIERAENYFTLSWEGLPMGILGYSLGPKCAIEPKKMTSYGSGVYREEAPWPKGCGCATWGVKTYVEQGEDGTLR